MLARIVFASVALAAALCLSADHAAACGGVSAAVVAPQCGYAQAVVAPQVFAYAAPAVQAIVLPQVQQVYAQAYVQPQVAAVQAVYAPSMLAVRARRAAVVAPVAVVARERVLRPSLFKRRVAVGASAAIVAPY